MKKAVVVVIDSGPLILGAPISDFANHAVTVPGVLKEIKDVKTRERIRNLPFLTIITPKPESVRHVVSASKKSGDIDVLSKVDFQVLALTYELNTISEDDLKTMFKRMELDYKPDQAGRMADHFFGSVNDDDDMLDVTSDESEGESDFTDTESVVSCELHDNQDYTIDEQSEEDDYFSINSNEEIVKENESFITDVEENVKCAVEESECNEDNSDDKEVRDEEKETTVINHVEEKLEIEQVKEVDLAEGDGWTSVAKKEKRPNNKKNENMKRQKEESDDDEKGWVTKENFHEMSQNNFGLTPRNSVMGEEMPENMKLGCLSTDYALQNVSMHMGIPVLSVKGMIINEIRTYVSRCRSCFKVWRKTGIFFCPHCGNDSLGRIPAEIKDGKMKLFLKKNFQLSARNNVFSIPKPQSGKHTNGNTYVYCADQRLPQERCKKNKHVDEGFMGSMPNQLNSRSAVLGIKERNGGNLRPSKPMGNKKKRTHRKK